MLPLPYSLGAGSTAFRFIQLSNRLLSLGQTLMQSPFLLLSHFQGAHNQMSFSPRPQLTLKVQRAGALYFKPISNMNILAIGLLTLYSL